MEGRGEAGGGRRTGRRELEALSVTYHTGREAHTGDFNQPSAWLHENTSSSLGLSKGG